MIKVFIGNLLSDIPCIELLSSNLNYNTLHNNFGENQRESFVSDIVEIVDKPDKTDYICIPHNLNYIINNKDYIDSFIKLSKTFSKKIIIFFVGDSSEYINIPNSIIFRMSQYLSNKKDNEIIIPAYSADLSYGNQIDYKDKRNIPVIGFCGWASIDGFLKNIIFWFKNTFLLNGQYRLGLYFRMKSIKILNKSDLVKTNFIIRKSYSANKYTIGLDPKQARDEYRKNIIESDFILAPKGDGNFSVRFYEALSLGRIPILLDTDCALPLDKDIDYSKFIIRVSYRDIDRLDKIVSDFYNKIPNEKWIEMQKNARMIFEKYLRIDSFFRFIFTEENIIKYISK